MFGRNPSPDAPNGAWRAGTGSLSQAVDAAGTSAARSAYFLAVSSLTNSGAPYTTSNASSNAGAATLIARL